jgi:hypothetical protein
VSFGHLVNANDSYLLLTQSIVSFLLDRPRVSMMGKTMCERSIGGAAQIAPEALSTPEQFVLGVCR